MNRGPLIVFGIVFIAAFVAAVLYFTSSRRALEQQAQQTPQGPATVANGAFFSLNPLHRNKIAWCENGASRPRRRSARSQFADSAHVAAFQLGGPDEL